MYDVRLHPVQLSVLDQLRHTPSARFSVLMRPTGLDSDVFKFHLRKLQKFGYITKNNYSEYELTVIGKEFANTLDSSSASVQKQPKLSVLIIAQRLNHQGIAEYVFQERQRAPHFGYWGVISGAIQWGEEPEATAKRELYKQTGLSGDIILASLYRKRDYAKEDEALLEDKLFLICLALGLTGELQHSWQPGRNEWMTLEKVMRLKPAFADNELVVKAALGPFSYHSAIVNYARNEY